MSIPQPEKASSEMRWVTRPGEIVAACTWDSGSGGLETRKNVWAEAIRPDPAAEARAERSWHYNRQGQHSAVWRTAGLEDVEELLRLCSAYVLLN